MASVSNANNQRHRQSPPQDRRCRYKAFDVKPEGRVACLAVGKDLADGVERGDGEIVGIAFQKVSTGRVKPVLPTDSFSKVNWVNRPTNPNVEGYQYIDLGDDVLHPDNVPPQWEDFAKTMKTTKTALLELMSPVPALEGERMPELLFEAFQNFAERNPDILYPTSLGQVVRQAKAMDAAYWTENSDILKWVKAVSEGCSGTPSHELADCFEVLFPECRQTNQVLDRQTTETFLRIPPADQETIQNATIRSGVPRCLVYGYDISQVVVKPVLKRRPVLKRQLWETDEDRGRPRHRVIRPKKLVRRVRSRSRSPVSDDEAELPQNVEHVGRNMPNQISVTHMLSNPDDYVLSTLSFHKFFESHKADLVCLETTQGQSGQYVAVAKFVCEISSWCREARSGVTIERHVAEVTEQCVRACLSALAYNQDSILGICVVVDGLKLIKIEKNQDHNGHVSYDITETHLVVWDDLDEIYVLLEMIRKEING